MGLPEFTKKNLEDAFWRLYEKKDISQISIGEITELAGYHRNTFYRYFTDIYTLLDAVEQQVVESITGVLKEHSLFDDKNILAACFIDVWTANSKYIRQFLREDRYSNFSRKLIAEITGSVKRKYCFVKDDEMNDYLLSFQIAGAITALFDYIRKDTHEISLEELMKTLFVFRDVTGYPLHRLEE